MTVGKGDRFRCSIWSGGMPGIYIGFPNRERYFSEEIQEIELEIDGETCKAKLPPSFWRSCPEIRVARDKTGRNKLREWIEKNNLLPPSLSQKIKGKKDEVVLEVIVPYKKFRIFIR